MDRMEQLRERVMRKLASASDLKGFFEGRGAFFKTPHACSTPNYDWIAVIYIVSIV